MRILSKHKRAIGVPKKKILYSHALNAGPTLVKFYHNRLGIYFWGGTLSRIVYYWPGMGLLLYDAITVNDAPLIIGIVLYRL